MRKQDRFFQLLTPSLTGGLATLGMSLAVLIAATVYYFLGSGTIYNYIFGQNSSFELVSQSQGAVDAVSNTVFGNPVLNKILYFAFWMMIGLLVYFVLYAVVKSTSSAVEDIEQTAYKNTRFHELMESFAARLAVRSAALIAYGLYLFIFIKVLLPFSILAARVGVNDFPMLTGWLYCFIALLVMTLSFHIHIVFLRLIMLKVRLGDGSTLS